MHITNNCPNGLKDMIEDMQIITQYEIIKKDQQSALQTTWKVGITTGLNFVRLILGICKFRVKGNTVVGFYGKNI